MPASRGVKRSASKSSASTAASTAPKSKKKRGAAIQLEIPDAPKKRGRLLACGQGDVGQLGLGPDVIETSKFQFVSALGENIVDASAGGMHTICLDKDGKIWTFGCNDEGALGRATTSETEEGTPATVLLPRKAVAVSAGDSHSAALLDNGDVYAWGSFRDSHGSMGLVVQGREGKPCKDPVKVEIGEQAVSIASGGDHLVILSSSGGVWTMGCGEQGQLGRLSQRSASRDARSGFSALLVPSKVLLKAGARHIWAGYHATVVLDSNDKVYAWGLNNYGQLGITGEKHKCAIYLPVACDAFGSGAWRGVAPGQHHSLALAAGGDVYSVGRCEYGRLGLGERTGDAESLEPIPALKDKKIVSISAGTCNSFAVTDSGEIFSWGMGSEGQLGTGSVADAECPRPAPYAPDRRACKVAAGGQHTVVLAIDPLAADKEPTPEPEMETEEEKVEDVIEKPEAKVEKKRPNKRQKKNDKLEEQEDEVTSTSSAQPSQKVNGDENKVEETMDVDDTDNKQEEKPEEVTQPEKPEETTETTTTETVEKPEPEPEPEPEKPETMDSSSQETTDSESKPEPEPKLNDVEMAEEKKELNGTPEVIEAKSVEDVNPSPVLTSTA